MFGHSGNVMGNVPSHVIKWVRPIRERGRVRREAMEASKMAFYWGGDGQLEKDTESLRIKDAFNQQNEISLGKVFKSNGVTSFSCMWPLKWPRRVWGL